jgi:hypothetical protein
MTPHLFLSKSETKSAACDGPNGMHSPPGPALVRHGLPKTNRAVFAAREAAQISVALEAGRLL